MDILDPKPTRRQLLVVAGCAVSACSLPPRMETTRVPVANGRAELTLEAFPALVTPGGLAAVQPQGWRHPVLVMRVEGGSFRALSMRCPHLGCTVRWDEGEQALRCPCHGSRFSDDGTRQSGPASHGLPTIEVSALDEPVTRIALKLPSQEP